MSQTLDKYKITKSIEGYITKADPTDIDTARNGRALIAGSQNMIINDQKRVESRAGYEIFGAEASLIKPPKSEFAWKNSSEGETFVREIDGNLQWYSAISSAWETLLTGLSTTRIVRFVTVWDNTQLIDILLFVNNSSILYNWSAAEATLASVTSTKVIVSETIADERFLITGTTVSLRVKDTGGTWREFPISSHTGSTFTVTGDPSQFIFAAGAVVVEAIRQDADTPIAGFKNDVIETFQNQVFIGSHTSQRLPISSNSDFTDYTFSSPRVAGEGAIVTLDATMVGLKTPGLRDSDTESKILAFAKNDRAYKITFEVSPGSTADREVPRVKPLPLAEGQGALSQELIGKVKQTVVWVSNDKELIPLDLVESGGFKDVAISDPIKPDFVAADFTNGDLKFWRNNIVITAPPDGKMFIFDTSKGFWQPPQIKPMRRLTIYNDLLYGHSNSLDETYQLFKGLNDDGNPISFKAHFAYRNANARSFMKNFRRHFVEMYIQANTIVDVSLLYEWKGAKRITTYKIDGANEGFLFTPVVDASLGVNPLGTNPLGGLLEAGEDTPKYRRFKPIEQTDHFEYQVRMEADAIDIAFQVMADGADIRRSVNLPQKLTK